MSTKWEITYAVERIAEYNADNINDAVKMAEQEKRPGERIVSIKIKR
ncbi:MAG: hypothetical protein ACXQTR_02605 [Candidatus Methanospirareceae archaeon]